MSKTENPVGAYCNTPLQNEKTHAPVGAKNVSPLQSVQPENNPRKSPVGATHRKLYLARLREEYANALFSKFLNDYPGTLTMKFSKGAWRLSFSWGHEKVQAQGKTLAHALINLATKSPSLGGVSDSEEVIWGGTSKTIAL